MHLNLCARVHVSPRVNWSQRSSSRRYFPRAIHVGAVIHFSDESLDARFDAFTERTSGVCVDVPDKEEDAQDIARAIEAPFVKDGA